MLEYNNPIFPKIIFLSNKSKLISHPRKSPGSSDSVVLYDGQGAQRQKLYAKHCKVKNNSKIVNLANQTCFVRQNMVIFREFRGNSRRLMTFLECAIPKLYI